MDSFEINKIVAAILMVALVIIGIGKISDVIFYVEKPKTPGYSVDIEQAVATSTTSSETTEENNVSHPRVLVLSALMRSVKRGNAALIDLSLGAVLCVSKSAKLYSVNEDGTVKIVGEGASKIPP